MKKGTEAASGRTVSRMLDNFTAATKALADPHRIRALMALRSGEKCVCQLIELLSLAPSTVSKHMTILKQAGLVDSRKDSRWVYYRLSGEAKRSIAADAMIGTTLHLLANDLQITDDDAAMAAIIAEGLDVICKRQRGGGGISGIKRKIFK